MPQSTEREAQSKEKMGMPICRRMPKARLQRKGKRSLEYSFYADGRLPKPP